MLGSRGALLLLTDGRLPSGGYAHSGGLEAAIKLGRVSDAADLQEFLLGLAHTSAMVSAAFAAAGCSAAANGRLGDLPELEAEFLARTPSPAQRDVSTALGRQLLRALAAVVPHPLHSDVPDRLCHPVALGVGAATLALEPADAARAMLHEALMGPAVAAVKLMSLDPFDAHRAFAATVGVADDLAARAASHADGPPTDLPSASAPLSEVFAEHHAVARTRLFAS